VESGSKNCLGKKRSYKNEQVVQKSNKLNNKIRYQNYVFAYLAACT